MISRQPTEHRMTLWDGTQVFYRAWQPPCATDRALLLFHRGHEHSGRWQEVVDRLALDDVAVFAWDARGHGRSSGERGYAPSFGCLVRDAESFAHGISRVHDIALDHMVVMAHSVGSVIAAAWVHDYAPPIRGMVLACPAFHVKLYVPFAIPFLRLLLALRGQAFVPSYVKARMLTHDPEEAAGYQADPLITRAIAVNILLGLRDTSERLVADAGTFHVPTLILTSGGDWVVRVSTQRRFFDGLGSERKALEVYPGLYHAIFNERGRERVIARAREFIQQCFEQPAPPPSLLSEHKGGFTYAEYERLSRPLSPWSPARLRFSLAHVFMRSVGRLSEGIRLGWRTGFDSGESLDYVYENLARGLTPLGRLIDRLYLDAPGWRGIRRRKADLEVLLRQAIELARAEGRPIQLLDIAAGPGRYVLELLRELRHLPISAVLRDREPRNLETGRRLAAAMRLENVVYEPGDAFDETALAAIMPRPTVAVVSGLYELFPDNNLVLRSLRGLAEALQEGGYLVYTNQPWHPQLEFIARVLVNREGRPWVMRRRTQAEMDELVCAAGFEKLRMEIDDDGIFTVSLCRRGRE